MRSEKIAQLTEQLDNMVKQLGLEKLAADGPVGESAGVIADSGTAQPAEQEAARSNIQPATEGAQSASNNQMLKDEVPDNTAEAKPSAADNSGAASSTENATTATYTGEKKDDFGSKQQTLDAPTTTHPADVNKDPEKYSADLRNSASFIEKEIEKMSSAKTGTPAAGSEETVGDRIGELLLGKEASAEDKDKAVRDSVTEYLGGYSKTASLIGEMTADALDILLKQAGELEDLAAAEAAAAGAEGAAEGEGIPAEALAADAGTMEGAGDEEAAALAQAAELVAAEIGITPEEVLELAAQELAAGDGGEAAALEAPAADMGAAPMAPEGESAPAEEEKMASVKAEELAELRKQAAELVAMKAAAEKAENDTHLQTLVTNAVQRSLAEMAAQKA